MATAEKIPLIVPDLLLSKGSIFDQNKGASFIQTTAAYMMQAMQTLNTYMTNSMQNMETEGQVSQSMVSFAKTMQQQAAQAWAEYEANQPSGGLLGEILGYVVSGFMLLVAVVTQDPMLFMMATASIIMQASGGQSMLENALPSSPGLKALCEFGIAAGEAIAFGGISGLAEETAASTAATAAGQAAKTTAKQAAAIALTIVSALGQTLMMSSFWPDVLMAAGCDEQSAAIFGMLIGMGFGLGLALAGSANSALSKLVRGGLAERFGSRAEEILDMLSLWFQMGRNVAQIATGGLNIDQGIQMKKQAEILKDDLAPAQSQFTLLQGLLEIWGTASKGTQTGLHEVQSNYQTISQSFIPLAEVFNTGY